MSSHGFVSVALTDLKLRGIQTIVEGCYLFTQAYRYKYDVFDHCAFGKPACIALLFCVLWILKSKLKCVKFISAGSIQNELLR